MKKNSVIILFIFFLCNGLLFCQTIKDSLGGDIIYPQFHDNFSAEENWQIHKEAYKRQLNDEGLTTSEIQKRIAEYENRKNEFIEKINEEKKFAAIRRQKFEKLRDVAKEQRNQAEILRQEFEKLRDVAEKQRNQAEILRQKSKSNRSQDALHRELADELRKQADIQGLKAEKQRMLADIQRLKAEKFRDIAEKNKNIFKNILTKNITISSQSSNLEPIIIDVNKKSTLLFKINGEISSGTTVIEIFNPKGKKEGELSLEHIKELGLTEQDVFSKSTSGSFHKTISDADIGAWQIKISSKKSEGNVNISVDYYVKPTMNE